MQRRKAATILMLLLVTVTAFGLGINQFLTVKAALADLPTAKLFAFGGVGFAGTHIKSEHEFETILALPRTRALQSFEAIYAKGTPEAKAYALAGFKALDATRFQALAAREHTSTTTVRTARGCIFNEQPLAAITSEIASGAYDAWLKSTRW